MGKKKTRLAKSVIEEVKAKGGRFVRKVEVGTSSASSEVNKSGCKAGDHYEEVPDALALDKTKQSFRHQLRGSKLTSLFPDDSRKEENRNDKRKMDYSLMGLDSSNGSGRRRISESIDLQRSMSISSGGATTVTSPTHRRSSSAVASMADGLLKLKALQHEPNDVSSFASSSPTTMSSLLDPYLLMGLRSSVLSPRTTSSELMRKELASRYFLAESILLGGGGGSGILEHALAARSQNLGFCDGILPTSSYYPPARVMHNPLSRIIQSQQLYDSSSSSSAVSHQCRLPSKVSAVKGTSPFLYESTRLGATRGLFVADMSQPKTEGAFMRHMQR